MNYDFIEIGACNFDTIIQNCDETATGLCVEPISYYLNQLPDRPFVKKLQLIISPNDRIETSEIWFVPEEEIIKHNLPHWLTGCNRINGFHLQHIILNVQHLVKKQSVRTIPISMLFEENDVDSVSFLKIDTEGCDCDILLCLAKYLATQPKTKWPKTICYESNILSPKEKQQEVNAVYQRMEYSVQIQSDDTYLKLC